MKVSLNFLKDFVKIEMPTEKLAGLLTLHTAEVESAHNFAENFKQVVIAKIFDIKKHPKGDNLFIAKADIGSKKIQIVFGTMFPIKEGELLPMAVAPAVLPTGIKVKKVNLRGIVSEGMVTSDSELGLSLSEEGLTRFPKSIKPGTPFTKALNLEDVVFEIDILPNRATDLLSHFGIAREIAALTKEKLNIPKIKIKEEGNIKTEDLIEVKVQDKVLCPRYIARVIDNVQIKESPLFLKSRLIALGIRPINNVVDITNYVMMELGEPLHAFNFNKLEGKNKKKIIVRQAKRGETIFTLDNKKRKLTPDVLLIADAKKGVAIAGIMGSRSSEVSSKTKRIILEAANFNPVNIRATSRLLGLQTEASSRFEKGIDPNLAEIAIDRAAFLIKELAGGRVLKEKVDFYPKKVLPKKMILKESYLKRFLGVSIKEKEIIDILTRLSFEVSKKNKNIFKITVPTFRLDINIPEELVEEVARIYGYDRIKSIPPIADLTAEIPNKSLNLRNEIKNILSNLSFSEVYNYSFQSENLIKNLGLKASDHLELLNPLDKEVRFLRTSVFPGLFLNLKKNLKNFDAFRIFEIGRIYLKKGPDKLPLEKNILSGIIVGDSESFYTAKGIIESLFEKLEIGFNNKNLRPISKDITEPYFGPKFFHPGKTAEILFGKKRLGVFGAFHPRLLEKVGVKKEIFGFSLDLDLILKEERIQKVFKPLLKYPELRRDLAIIVDKDILVEDVCNIIQRAAGEMVKNIDLFDIYKSEKIGLNKKSLAFHISYGSEKRTLSDNEVNKLQNKIEKALFSRLNAEIRKE